MNRAHPNKELFQEMLRMGIAMFKASGRAKKGTLGVCPVRLKLKNSRENLDMHGWVTDGHVKLETIGSTTYIIVWMLKDSGAQCSVMNKHLMNCIDFIGRGEFKERISGYLFIYSLQFLNEGATGAIFVGTVTIHFKAFFTLVSYLFSNLCIKGIDDFLYLSVFALLTEYFP